MTQDEIIEMARQAAKGKLFFAFFPQLDIGLLEAFAKLVAAKEREACLKIQEECQYSYGNDLAKAIRARGEA